MEQAHSVIGRNRRRQELVEKCLLTRWSTGCRGPADYQRSAAPSIAMILVAVTQPINIPPALPIVTAVVGSSAALFATVVLSRVVFVPELPTGI